MPSSRPPLDLVFIPKTRIALLACDEIGGFLQLKNREKAANGLITAVKLPLNMQSFPTIYPVKIDNLPANFSFHPSGLTIFEDNLYVINDGNRIEVFRIEDVNSMVRLIHNRSIFLSKTIPYPINDLILISKTDLILTVSRNYEGNYMEKLSIFLGFAHSHAYRCRIDDKNDIKCDLIASGGVFSGITKRGNEVYLVDSVWKSIGKYNVTEQEVRQVEKVQVEYMVQGVEYDQETDKVYVGIVDRGGDYLASVDKMKIGENEEFDVIPSGCAEFSPATNTLDPIVIQRRQSGITSCARKDQFLAMGSLHDPHILVCPLQDPKSS